MAITFGQAKNILAQYAGRGGLCADDPEVDLFVKEVLQYLIYKGPESALRTYCFTAQNGCITIPYELEVPIKVKMDGSAGTVWSSWFKYYDTGKMHGACIPAENALFEEASYFPTVYDLPAQGSRVGILGVCNEDPDAHVIVKGYDPTGREIFTVHKGEQISGEYLSIVRGKIMYTTATFGKITNVVKTKTNGYTTLYSYDVDTKNKLFLADYNPFEEIPQYRRFRLTTPCKDGSLISVLGRIRLKENYADSDPIPIENIHVLKVAAQGIQLQENNDLQGAAAKNKTVGTLMTEENQYKKVSAGAPINFHHATSPGAIRGIIGGSINRFGFRKRW